MKGLQKIIQKVHFDDSSLSGAIEQTLKGGATDPRMKLWSPWKPFPNVKDFRVEVSKFDELFLKFGIKKRLDPATHIYKTYRNRDLNRYVEHQILRMNRYLTQGNDAAYGRMVKHLMRSRVWYLLAVKHIFPRWHREIPGPVFMNMRRRFLKIVESDIQDINFARVYLSKGEGKGGRPLGVPRAVGRIYLHMLNQFLVKRLEPTISPSQHGFRPGRGTLTAGLEVLDKVIKSDFIYEYDYKGFFDQLNIDYITQTLKAHKVPDEFIKIIDSLNRSIPVLASKDLKDETVNRAPWLTGSAMPNPNYPNISLGKSGITALLATYDHAVGFKSLFKQQGVPQGSPTSPFLSILALDKALSQVLIPRLEYADDGLMYSDQDFTFSETPEMKKAGVEIAKEKSHGIKRDGKGLKPLKFLGMEYDGTTNTLRAHTRKGSRLVYDKASLLEAVEAGIAKPYTTKHEGAATWDQFVRSKFAGFIQSRLYNGSWNQDELWQNFELTFHQGSGVDEYRKWQLGFNATAASPRATVFKELRHEMATRLNVFNSTSLATRSALEALRIAEGQNSRKAIIRPVEEGKRNATAIPSKNDPGNTHNAPTTDTARTSKTGGQMTKHDKMNVHRGMKAYCSALTPFQTFLLSEIDRMEPYSRFTREQMWTHYHLKYGERKLQYGEVLIREARILTRAQKTLQ